MATHPNGLTLGTIKESNARYLKEGLQQIVTSPVTVQYLLDIIAEKEELVQQLLITEQEYVQELYRLTSGL